MRRNSRRRRSKRHRILPALAVAITIVTVWSIWGNTALTKTDVTFTSNNIPKELDGLVIAHVTDLHDALIGEDNATIVEMLTAAHPDIIALTGDMIDSNRVTTERTLSLCERLCEIAPVYYVNGNHEAALPNSEYARLKKGLEQEGVTVLEDESVILSYNGARFQLIGLRDIGFISGGYSEKVKAMEDTLMQLKRGDMFTVLLAHRPELFEHYAKAGVDLTLCGHAHGGQIRLPFIGGIYSPGQGFFPKYDSGVYQMAQSHMEVSRGIGNSKFPLRVNNRPEIVFITLRAA